MFLRLPLRSSGKYVLFNVDHIVRVEPGDQEEKEPAWCRIHHLPVKIADDGSEVLSTTDVAKDIDHIGMLLSGKWMKEPM